MISFNFLKFFLSLYLVDGCLSQQNHCPNSQTRHKCASGQGDIWANTNQNNWNPDSVVNAGHDDHWNCEPCCLVAGTSLQLCVDDNQQYNEPQHCPNSQVRQNCRQGQVLANTNQNYWDPNEEVNVGNGWNCDPCCLLSGTSIPQCHENERENIEDFGRGGNGQENNANRRGGNIVSGRRIRPRQNNPMRPGRIQRRSFQ